MIAITSISPGHKNYNNQLRAVRSWIDAGYEVVSLNAEEEIEVLKESFQDVKFISTNRHNKKLFGKPYVIVSAIIDYLKEVKSKYSLVINSDIIIDDKTGYTKRLKELSEESIIIMNRIDFDGDMETGRSYESGFDAFFINEKHLDMFPQTILCLGQCHWDFWLPYMAIMNGAKVIKSKERYIYHQVHTVQYSKENWIRTAEIFRAEAGLLKYKNVGQSTSRAYSVIKAFAQ